MTKNSLMNKIIFTFLMLVIQNTALASDACDDALLNTVPGLQALKTCNKALKSCTNKPNGLLCSKRATRCMNQLAAIPACRN